MESVKRPFEGLRYVWVPPSVEPTRDPAWLCGGETTMGRGTNLRVAGTFTTVEERLGTSLSK